jgi:PAS domain S-box-containing protein
MKLAAQAAMPKGEFEPLAPPSSQLSQPLFQSILDTAPMGIWVADVAGKAQFVNKTLCGVLGIAEQQFLQADHYTDALPAPLAALCRQADAELLAQRDGPNLSTEVLSLDDAGEATGGKIFEITKVKLFGQDGSLNGLIGLALDITAREQAEARSLRGRAI